MEKADESLMGNELLTLKQLCQINPEGSGDFQKRMERWAGLKALDVTQTGPADPGHFGKALLGDPLLDSRLAKGFTDGVDGLLLSVGLHA